MPTSVADVFASARMRPAGAVAWGTRVPATRPGVYVVSLTDSVDSTAGALAVAPVAEPAVMQLLDARPELRVDGERPDLASLRDRLAAFWLPDEVIVYIGLAGTSLQKRVGDYYKTPLGARSPHAGGWALKTLAVLDELVVHYAPCADVDRAERLMLAQFAAGVSASTRKRLHDKVRVMPFANLEAPRGRRKVHGITGARAPRATSTTSAAKESRRGAAGSRHEPSPTQKVAGGVAPQHHTRPVTAADRAAGRIRIGRGATKRLFPSEPSRVQVELRGHEKRCSWNPRYGPPERSGVLGIGHDLLGTSVAEGDALRVERKGDRFLLT
jgi:hypothetical protein